MRLGLATVLRGRAVALLSARSVTLFDTGPLDAAGAWLGTQQALAHGLVVFAVGLALAVWGRAARGGRAPSLSSLSGPTWPLPAAASIWTVPQADFEITPEIARRIEAAELRRPRRPVRSASTGCRPGTRTVSSSRASPARLRELFRWYRETLHTHDRPDRGPGLRAGEGGHPLSTITSRSSTPRFLPARAEAAQVLGIKPGQPICYFPRRGYDLWGVRYFILPVGTIGWKTEDRGFAAFLPETDIIYPGRDQNGYAGEIRALGPAARTVQLLRNKAAYPAPGSSTGPASSRPWPIPRPAPT